MVAVCSSSKITGAVRVALHAWTMANDATYELAYAEARRALDEQERAVVELRSRAGQLIAAAAITTSFFGGQALRGRIHGFGWAAIGCFVGLSLSVLAILWPRRDWEFVLSPRTSSARMSSRRTATHSTCLRFIVISRCIWAAAPISTEPSSAG